MIQRPQSVWLALAVILGIVCISVQFYSWVLLAIMAVASAVNLYTIFIYRQRPRQALLCLISIMLYVVWYIALIAYSKQVAPDAADFHLAWSDALPAVCVILTFMARKGVLADEAKVRAADRIR